MAVLRVSERTKMLDQSSTDDVVEVEEDSVEDLEGKNPRPRKIRRHNL